MAVLVMAIHVFVSTILGVDASDKRRNDES